MKLSALIAIFSPSFTTGDDPQLDKTQFLAHVTILTII